MAPETLMPYLELVVDTKEQCQGVTALIHHNKTGLSAIPMCVSKIRHQNKKKKIGRNSLSIELSWRTKVTN